MTSSHQCLVLFCELQGLKNLFFYRRESAYQCTPTTGLHWREKTYIDSALPFGLRSVPKVVNAVADAMQWILEQHGVKPMLQYLDDFLVIGTRECKQALETALGLCCRLGIPISVHKTEGPSDIPAMG